MVRPLPSRREGEDDQPVAMPAVLDQVLAGLGAPTVSEIVVIHERWAEVVGEELVDHTQPVSIDHGTLRVAVDSPAWANHLRWSEAEILSRLERLLGPGVVTAVTARAGRR